MRPLIQTFRLSEDEVKALRQQAEREGVSPSALLRRALAAYLAPPAPRKATRRRTKARGAPPAAADTPPVTF